MGSRDSIMVLDPLGHIRWISRTAPGLTVEQVIGTTVYQYVPEPQHATMRSCFERVLSTGNPDSYEVTYEHPGGVSFWQSQVSTFIEGGDVTGVLVIARDVTEFRQAILQRDRFWRTSKDLMCVASFEGYFLDVNVSFEQTLGWTHSELTHQPFFEFIHAEDRDATRAEMGRLMEGAQVAGYENRYRCKNGSYRTLSWSAVPDLEGRQIMASARDVTDQRRLEAQLLAAQKMEAIGQLAGGIAHDFNNLLLAIKVNTQFAKQASRGNSEMLEYLNDVERAADQSEDLVKQLLTVGQHRRIVKTEVDLNDMLRQLRRLLRRVIPESITIDVDAGRELPLVLGDGAKLEQMMLNFAINARDAMPNGGALSLSAGYARVDDVEGGEVARAPAGYVCVTVADDGHGMPPDVLERIFDPFFTTKPPGQGTGLGLATAYGIAEQHGGMIRVTSQVDKGTQVKVYIPATADSRVRDSGRAPVILLGEDNALVRRMALKLLERSGFTVLVAEDGQEALRLFQERKDEVRLALLDVVMPNMSGPEAYERMVELVPDLPVVFATGYSTSPLLERAAENPSVRVLAKPYKPDTLIGVIHEVLGVTSD